MRLPPFRKLFPTTAAHMSPEQAHIAAAEGESESGRLYEALPGPQKGAAGVSGCGPHEIGQSLEKKDGIRKLCQAMVGFATPIPLERMHEEVDGYGSSSCLNRNG